MGSELSSSATDGRKSTLPLLLPETSSSQSLGPPHSWYRWGKWLKAGLNEWIMNTVSQPSWLLSMFPTHLHMAYYLQMYSSKYIIDTSVKVLKWLTNSNLPASMQESLLWRYWMDMVRSRASHQFSSSPSLSATSSPAIGSLTIYKVCPKAESTGNQLTET